MVIAPRAFHFGIAFGPGITVAVNISTAPHASTIAYAMGFLVQLSHDVEELVNRARSKADAKADAKEAVFPVARSLARRHPPRAPLPGDTAAACSRGAQASLRSTVPIYYCKPFCTLPLASQQQTASSHGNAILKGNLCSRCAWVSVCASKAAGRRELNA